MLCLTDMATELVKAFGELLTQLRESEEKTQADVCRLTGIKTGHLPKIENGKRERPDPVYLLKLADAYRVSLRGLIKALEHNRRDRNLTVDQLRETFARESDGPSPAMAKALLREAQIEIFRYGVALDTFINTHFPPPELGGQTSAASRRPPDESSHGGATGGRPPETV